MKKNINYLAALISLVLLFTKCKEQSPIVGTPVDTNSKIDILFTPISGDALDTITITHMDSNKQFATEIFDRNTNTIEKLKVFFVESGKYGRILSVEKNKIKVEAPCGVITSKIRVEEPIGIFHYGETFTVMSKAPIQDLFKPYYPTSATVGSSIKIIGRYFGTDISKVEVIFPGGGKASVISVQCNEILVQVPAIADMSKMKGAITVKIDGKDAKWQTGEFTYIVSPFVNPFTNIKVVTNWPGRYTGGDDPSSAKLEAICVDPKSGAIYIWDKGENPMLQGRIMISTDKGATFQNLLNTRLYDSSKPIYWQNIKDMDIYNEDSVLYVAEGGIGAFWKIDLTKVKANPIEACESIGSVYTDIHRNSFKLFPWSYSGTSTHRNMVYTRNGGANSELRFARWFSLPSIEEERGNFSSAAGVELVAKEGSYYGYVTDKLTGTVTKIDALFKQATPEVVLSGLDHPRDIVKNNERFYIACKDGIKLYDDKFNYLYTFELKHPTTGQIYSPSLIALSPEGNKMYVISEESDNLFIFE